MAEEQIIPILVNLLASPLREEVQVEVAYTLGCVVLGNRENQERLSEEPLFKHDLLLDLLDTPDSVSQTLNRKLTKKRKTENWTEN